MLDFTQSGWESYVSGVSREVSTISSYREKKLPSSPEAVPSSEGQQSEKEKAPRSRRTLPPTCNDYRLVEAARWFVREEIFHGQSLIHGAKDPNLLIGLPSTDELMGHVSIQPEGSETYHVYMELPTNSVGLALIDFRCRVQDLLDGGDPSQDLVLQ